MSSKIYETLFYKDGTPKTWACSWNSIPLPPNSVNDLNLMKEVGHVPNMFLPLTKASRIGAKNVAFLIDRQVEVALIHGRRNKFGWTPSNKCHAYFSISIEAYPLPGRVTSRSFSKRCRHCWMILEVRIQSSKHAKVRLNYPRPLPMRGRYDTRYPKCHQCIESPCGVIHESQHTWNHY